MDFEQGTLGPFPFYSSTISPDSKAFIDVPIPSSVNPGNWKIFVSASQGNVTETREFEKNLTFTNRFNFLGAAIRVVALVLGLVLALWAYRTLRPQGNRVTHLSPMTKRFRRNKKRMADKEIQDLIARSRERAYAAELKASRLQKSTAKKSATKKSATKKAAAKKSAAKKSATKKSATKKSATKKSATKKSATKKSATKKSATKKSTS
jgi:Mg-chelatase subunit ChlI